MTVAYVTFPDAEAMAATILKSRGICSGRVYSSRPKVVILPLAVVQRLGGIPKEPRSIDHPRIQVDIWGSNKSEARREAENARRALFKAQGEIFATLGGYLSAVEDETGITWLPDPETMEDRYIFGVLLTTRAIPSGVT